MPNYNQQNQNILTGTQVKDIPYSQTNVSTIDPTPGIILALVFVFIIAVIIYKVDFWTQKFFDHKVKMDELELKYKYPNYNI